MSRLRILACLLLGVALLAPINAQQARPYRILVSNDDGVRDSGLAALAQVLQAIGEVTIVAPSTNQTGTSQSVNTTEPLLREDITLPNGMKAIGLAATPATTVNIALQHIVVPAPDLVVVGINRGLNVGLSAYLSGTVGATRMAAMMGVPAIAASRAGAGTDQDLVAAAEEVLGVARRVKQYRLPSNTFLNVNVPAVPEGGFKGYLVTTQAMVRAGRETFAESTHPGTGRTLYWSQYKEGGVAAPEGTDAWAVQNGFVSVTPMRVGEHDPGLASAVKSWFQ